MGGRKGKTIQGCTSVWIRPERQHEVNTAPIALLSSTAASHGVQLASVRYLAGDRVLVTVASITPSNHVSDAVFAAFAVEARALFRLPSLVSFETPGNAPISFGRIGRRYEGLCPCGVYAGKCDYHNDLMAEGSTT